MMPEQPVPSHPPLPVELLTSRALRTGVWGSVMLFLAGLIGTWFFPTATVSPLLLSAGVILLISTPFLRVLFAIVGFSMERDRTFVIVSLGVFLMLLGELAYVLMFM